MRIRVFAPAKINLALHVTGRRADGYHLLDSLVAFASVGDWLTLGQGGAPGLTVAGPEAAGVPADAGNLVARVADAFWRGGPLHLHLEKHLPVASGIGGGSADAAAGFRGIRHLLRETGGDGVAAPMPDAMARLLQMGADIPMCVASRPARIGGIGDRIELLPDLPHLPVLLINPRLPIATPDVFRALARADHPPMDDPPGDLSDTDALIFWLSRQRNDLQAAAIALAPGIAQVLDAVQRTDGCRLARMSGSGATCFGIYSSAAHTGDAAAHLSRLHPGWWVRAAVLDGQTRAAPQLIRATT